MMRTIYKYNLDLRGPNYQEVKMPSSARFLSVDSITRNYEDGIQMWFEVESNRLTTTRTFTIFGTGHTMPTGDIRLDYLGTVLTPPFVWHVYESID